jgi:hypothetical protein
MDVAAIEKHARRPRFRRAAKPPPFRVTEYDITIIRHIARHRFLRSTHIAALVGRSLDRVNDRLLRLFHAGYVDRPRAQLDYYPNSGSAPMVYALADLGAHLLAERDGSRKPDVEFSRRNRSAGRPFIDHQLEIVDFYVSLQCATRRRSDVSLIHSEDIVAGFPEETRTSREPLSLRASVAHQGTDANITIVPDLTFGLRFPDGSRRCFLVEIDRGTMPITRSDVMQTSFERKMRAYLAAYAARQHDVQFGWKTFRVLTVTTDSHRMKAMMENLRTLAVPAQPPGVSLFFFTTRDQVRQSNPLAVAWRDGGGREVRLM